MFSSYIMKCLELFSGTKSFSKVIPNMTSVDIDKKSKPDICIDIMDLDYKTLWKPHEFCYIHASPPCTDYSCINRSHPNKVLNIEKSNDIVKRTIEIIEYLEPVYWTIENPQTGTLKDQPFMKDLDLPYFDIDYCRFGYDYRKRTRFWSNMEYPTTSCLGSGKCEGMIGKRHKLNLGNGQKSKVPSLKQKYSIPPDFVKSIYQIVIT